MVKQEKRIAKQTIEFPASGTFKAYYAASGWCHENGYSHGSMCMDMPIAIMKGTDWNIAKWKNLSTKEINTVDGVMLSTDFREGSVTIVIY